MNIHQFLEVINANRELLGDPREEFGTGCPLRVAMVVHFGCPCVDYWIELFHGPSGRRLPINPDPERAADFLGLDETFTGAVANGWDVGKFYDDSEGTDWNYAFAGFLIGFTLRPTETLRQLTAG